MIRASGGIDDDNAETRIGSKIKPQPNGCWLYGARPSSYGSASIGGGSQAQAHRFVYETLVGPIPEGHVLHHECETPGCVNPAHLVPLTRGDHARRHAEMRKAS